MRKIKYPLIKHIFKKQDTENIKRVLKSGWLTKGEFGKKVEFEIKKYTRAKYSCLVNSATSALICSIKALKFPKDSKIVVPSFTFPAVANAVVVCGYRPVFCDIDLDTFNISPQSLENVIDRKTKAVIVVHEFGLSSKMDSILKIANLHNLKVIEDAACSLGAEFKGKKVGTFGELGVYSFHPRKVISCGEGGCVVSNDSKLIKQVKILSDHGSNNGNFIEAGYNFRLSDIQSALLLSQLTRIEKIITQRIKLALNYKNLLKDAEEKGILKTPVVGPDLRHTFQSFVILLSKNINRDKLKNFLLEKGIETQFGTYCVPILKFYRDNFKTPAKNYKNSLFAYRQSLTLPLYSGMNSEDQEYIAYILKKGIKKCAL